MKTTKRNTNVGELFNDPEKQRRYNEVHKVFDAIDEAIPKDAPFGVVLDAFLSEIVMGIENVYREAGRDIAHGCYEYCMTIIQRSYEDFLKEEEHG